MKEKKGSKARAGPATLRSVKRTAAQKHRFKASGASRDVTEESSLPLNSGDSLPSSLSDQEESSSVCSSSSEKKHKSACSSNGQSRQTPRTEVCNGPSDAGSVTRGETADAVGDKGPEVLVFKCEGFLDTSQSFKDFGSLHLDRRLTKVLTDVLNLQHPTNVQAQVVPLALEGRDLVIEGKTGSGKTLAYALPLLQLLLRLHAQLQLQDEALPPFSGIVLVPTKELCLQVYEVLIALLKYTNDIVTVSHTAAPQGTPGGSLPTIMVATPTGLLQYFEGLRHFQQGLELQLSLRMLVVDEADLLFAFGFERDTKRLLQLLPSTAGRHYQTLLVSATQNQELAELQNLMLHKPLVVRIDEASGAQECCGSVGEFYFKVPTETEKWLVAYAFLRLGLVPLKCLVFCKDVSNVYALRLFLDRFGIASGVLSPTLPVAAREQQIQAFNQGLIDILITSDGQGEEAEDEACHAADDGSSCFFEAPEQQQQTEKGSRGDAAPKMKEAEFAGHRGLDLQDVACVFNFDAPNSVKSYIHRIGRTGRGGSSGVSVTLVEESQEQQRRLLTQLLRSRKVPGTTNGTAESTLTPLSLQLEDVECFRYRVEDVKRSLTKRVIAAAVARDLQQQLLNSRRLKEFFERNPRDKEVLKRACKQLKEINVSKGHLGHLPDYLLSQTQPTQVTAVQLAIQQQKASRKNSKGLPGRSRRLAAADPLKTFKAAVARGGPSGNRRKARRPLITREGQLAKMPRHPDEVPCEALPATSGRKLWKLRHNKRVGVKPPKGNFLRKRSIKGLRKK